MHWGVGDDTGRLIVRLLGPVRLLVGATDVALGGAKQRTVLAVLATSPSKVVPADHVVAAVWGEQAPDRATATLQVYVSNLRRAIADAGGPPVLRWQAPGYVLAVPDEQVDLGLFRLLTTKARAQSASGSVAEAASTLREALALWHGSPMSGLVQDGSVTRQARGLENERRAALEMRLDLELAEGKSLELVPELSALVDEAPLDEGLAGRLIVALYRAGRQADAFAAFARVRSSLAEELGVDPGPQLRALEADLLAQSAELMVPSPAVVTASKRTTMRWTPDPSPSAWLVQAGGHRIPLGDADVVVGRDDDCGFVLTHASVSRRHCVISRAPEGGHLIADLGSTNGTTVNGRPLSPTAPRLLADGDEIGAGALAITYVLIEPGDRT